MARVKNLKERFITEIFFAKRRQKERLKNESTLQCDQIGRFLKSSS